MKRKSTLKLWKKNILVTGKEIKDNAKFKI